MKGADVLKNMYWVVKSAPFLHLWITLCLSISETTGWGGLAQVLVGALYSLLILHANLNAEMLH